jgi:hypothetical protein
MLTLPFLYAAITANNPIGGSSIARLGPHGCFWENAKIPVRSG